MSCNSSMSKCNKTEDDEEYSKVYTDDDYDGVDDDDDDVNHDDDYDSSTIMKRQKILMLPDRLVRSIYCSHTNIQLVCVINANTDEIQQEYCPNPENGAPIIDSMFAKVL